MMSFSGLKRTPWIVVHDVDSVCIELYVDLAIIKSNKCFGSRRLAFLDCTCKCARFVITFMSMVSKAVNSCIVPVLMLQERNLITD